MFTVYSPQLDVMPLLNHDQEAIIKYYWDFRWVVELGRIDIHVKGALLYCCLFQPQKEILINTSTSFLTLNGI